MNPFQRTGIVTPGRSVFNLSYEKKFTADMGQLIPIMCDEVVPGDIFKIGNEAVIRLQPLVAPILHEINITTHYYFVPYRILWEDWEEFITGGEDGTAAPSIPTWTPTSSGYYTLWDYLGFPVEQSAIGAEPLDFPRRAYNRIFNEYYRAEEIMELVEETNEEILYRCWDKDYFTNALLHQQRGTAPALPVSGTTSAIWASPITTGMALWPAAQSSANQSTAQYNLDNFKPLDSGTHDFLENNNVTIGRTELNNNTVSLSSATTFDVSDIRLATQMQRILERNNRAGARYTSWLHAHFNVSPRDDRLQRPEYIGGSKCPVIISEVLQTSATGTTPQGRLAGHGIAASRQFCGSYRATEFGLIMGIMSITPKPVYQDGINRQWLSLARSTRYDFYMPELANISEQAIFQGEIFIDDDAGDPSTIFGYTGRYDEMRYKPSMVVSGMRNTFDYWHISRQFATAPELNTDFLQMSAISPRKDIFAAPSEKGFIVSFGNIIKAIRPLPIMSQPGLMDHV